jgi:hypothetical protein
MRRIFAMVTSLLLVLVVAGPAGAEGPQINYVTIGSATVDRSGSVHIQGTLWCSQPMDVQVQWGQVEQTVGRKTTIRGGFGGWYSCNGTTPWETWARAESGSFASGWAWIGVKFEGLSCDETGCSPLEKVGGGTEEYLKISHAK